MAHVCLFSGRATSAHLNIETHQIVKENVHSEHRSKVICLTRFMAAVCGTKCECGSRRQVIILFMGIRVCFCPVAKKVPSLGLESVWKTHLVTRDEKGGPHKDPRDPPGNYGAQKELILYDGAVPCPDDGHVGHVRLVGENWSIQVNNGDVFCG